MKPLNDLFNADGHLSEEGIALWADALAESRTNTLPAPVAEHVDHCLACKAAIVEIRHMVRELDLPEVKLAAETKSRMGTLRSLYSKNLTFARLAAVALVLFAIGATLTLFVFNQRHNPDNLFAQNFTPYPDLVTAKGMVMDEDSLHLMISFGFSYYQKADYDTAAIVFQHLYNENPSSDTIAFYLANSVLATDKSPAQAIDILTDLSARPGVFKEQAGWYLALAFLKKHNVDTAKKQLLLLISTSDAYQKRARALLDEIK